jgi:hypothetical protein
LLNNSNSLNNEEKVAMEHISIGLSKKSFKDIAKKIHKNKYCYIFSEYKNAQTKIEISCLIHGKFYQTPAAHIYQRQGCPKCKGKHKSNNDIIKEFKNVHGEKYNYSLVKYKGVDHKVKIICPEHGEFEQAPRNHRKGHGCQKCAEYQAHLRNKKEASTFFRECIEKHNGFFDYSISNYVNEKTPIKVVCPIHGEFKTIPFNHLHKGTGCPKCIKPGKPTGFNPNKKAVLYYIFDPVANLYKIGITNKSVEERFGKSFCSNRAIAILEQTYFENGWEALEAEKNILEEFSYARVNNEVWPPEKGGNTEFFNQDILNKDSK